MKRNLGKIHSQNLRNGARSLAGLPAAWLNLRANSFAEQHEAGQAPADIRT